MNDSNHTKQKEIEKIEIKLEEILREKFYTGAEHFSQLSAIDLFWRNFSRIWRFSYNRGYGF